MVDGEPEEAGEAERLDARVPRLERAAQHLRAHVDAERGLERRSAARLRRLGRDAREERGLRRALGRVLERGVDPVVLRRRDRLGVPGEGGAPLRADPVPEPLQERGLPHEARGEHLEERGVALAAPLGLPAGQARGLRPAAEVDQEPVERRFGGGRLDPDLGRGGGQRGLRLDRQGVRARAESRQAGERRRQVAPRVIDEALPERPLRHGPERLTPVEMRGGDHAQPLGDDGGPVRPRNPRGEVRDGGKRLGRRAGPARRRAQNVRGEPRRLRRGDEVPLPDPAVRDPGRDLGSVQRHPRPGDPGHSRGRGREVVLRMAEVGVHRDRLLERPHRRDARAGGLRRREELEGGAGVAAVVHHGASPVAFMRRPSARSTAASA